MFNLLLFQLNFIIPPPYICWTRNLKTNVGPINFCPPSNLCVFISNMKYDIIQLLFLFVCYDIIETYIHHYTQQYPTSY